MGPDVFIILKGPKIYLFYVIVTKNLETPLPPPLENLPKKSWKARG